MKFGYGSKSSLLLLLSTLLTSIILQLTPLAAESLADGIHCTVKHDDKIFRAILNDVADTNNISAVLPDYGNVITTSLDKVSEAILWIAWISFCAKYSHILGLSFNIIKKVYESH